MPRSDPAAELAARMIEVLQRRSRSGEPFAPLTLRQLAEQADAQAVDLAAKAGATAAFARRAVVTQKKNPNAPVALLEDAERLASSPALLEFVLGAVATPQKPAWPLTQLRSKVPAALKKPFGEALARHVRARTLPDSVGAVQAGKTFRLYLKRLPPPEVALGEKLLRVLRQQRDLGGGAYPVTLRRLAELADSVAAPAQLVQAAALPGFQSAVSSVQPKDVDAPLALAGDAERLADSPALLEYALRSARTATGHAFAVTALGKKVTADLRQSFLAAVNRRLESGSLPPSVGWVLSRGKLLFLMADLNGGRAPPVPVPSAKPAPAPAPAAVELRPPAGPDLATRFHEAFTGLDRQNGSHNFVSLAELRKALAVDRAAFDAELHRLRRAGRYSLVDAEGRHTINPEERGAGIEEGGALFLYVSRKSP